MTSQTAAGQSNTGCPNILRKGANMKFVLFKDLQEERSTPQYGIVGDSKKSDVFCLCCGGTVEYGDYEIIRIVP